MKRKPKKPGNATMKAAKRKKLEVWLEPADFAAFETLCKSQFKTKAKVARALIRYVNAGGVTAINILKGVASDAEQRRTA